MSDANPTADQLGDAGVEKNDLEDRLTARDTWVRLLFMLAFGVIAYLVLVVTALVTAFSFLVRLFTGESNSMLQQAGAASASYLAEIIRFLTYNDEQRPFPFGRDFPNGD